MVAINELAALFGTHSRGELAKSRAEVKSLKESLRRPKEDLKNKTGEAMFLKEEWRKAREEQMIFETEVATQKTKVAEFLAERERDIRCESRAMHCEIADRYRGVLALIENKWSDKKKELEAEIQLREVIANIDLLSELKEGGLIIDEELARLKQMEKDCEALSELAAVPNWTLSDFDLPEVSGHSVGDDASSEDGGS